MNAGPPAPSLTPTPSRSIAAHNLLRLLLLLTLHALLTRPSSHASPIPITATPSFSPVPFDDGDSVKHSSPSNFTSFSRFASNLASIFSAHILTVYATLAETTTNTTGAITNSLHTVFRGDRHVSSIDTLFEPIAMRKNTPIVSEDTSPNAQDLARRDATIQRMLNRQRRGRRDSTKRDSARRDYPPEPSLVRMQPPKLSTKLSIGYHEHGHPSSPSSHKARPRHPPASSSSSFPFGPPSTSGSGNPFLRVVRPSSVLPSSRTSAGSNSLGALSTMSYEEAPTHKVGHGSLTDRPVNTGATDAATDEQHSGDSSNDVGGDGSQDVGGAEYADGSDSGTQTSLGGTDDHEHDTGSSSSGSGVGGEGVEVSMVGQNSETNAASSGHVSNDGSSVNTPTGMKTGGDGAHEHEEEEEGSRAADDSGEGGSIASIGGASGKTEEIASSMQQTSGMAGDSVDSESSSTDSSGEGSMSSHGGEAKNGSVGSTNAGDGSVTFGGVSHKSSDGGEQSEGHISDRVAMKEVSEGDDGEEKAEATVMAKAQVSTSKSKSDNDNGTDNTEGEKENDIEEISGGSERSKIASSSNKNSASGDNSYDKNGPSEFNGSGDDNGGSGSSGGGSGGTTRVEVSPKAWNFRGVEGGLVNGENITQLSLMVYKLAKTEGVTSLAAAPCYEVRQWMPTVVHRLESEVIGFEFFCIDTSGKTGAMAELKEAYGEVSGGYVDAPADEAGNRLPKGLDLVVSWMGMQQWGLRKSWRFIKGVRRSGAKLILLGNNPIRNNLNTRKDLLNVRKSPLLFNEPKRVINQISADNSKQLLLYALDKVRDGF